MIDSYRYRRTAFVVVAMLFGISVAEGQAAKGGTAKGKAASAQGRFKLTAPDLVAKGRITAVHVFNGMGCTGQNISPALNWSNPPAGGKAFAITADDTDAPSRTSEW